MPDTAIQVSGADENDVCAQMAQILRGHECVRDSHWVIRKPDREDRLLWRAHLFLQLVQPLPNQSILELGAGYGLFTGVLNRASQGRNPITAVSFQPQESLPMELPKDVEFLSYPACKEMLSQRRFDFVILSHLLDHQTALWLFHGLEQLLNPSGQVLIFDDNRHNPGNSLRRFRNWLFKRGNLRSPLPSNDIEELMISAGFSETTKIYNDFVKGRPGRPFYWLSRNLSTILENTPGIRKLARTMLVHSRKLAGICDCEAVTLSEHTEFNHAVSVVIPCHNEEMNIGPMIAKLKQYYPEYLYEIIPVDDCSTDRTAAIIRSMAAEDPVIKPIFRTPPGGVGRAISDGISSSKGNYVLSLDCDFHHILPSLRDFFDAAKEGYDVVVGSRFSRYSALVNYPLTKIIANRGFHCLAKLLLLRRFRDLTNNMKLIRRDVIQHLTLKEPGFAVNAEIGFQPLVRGFSIKEVPVSWIGRGPEMGVSAFRLIRAGAGYCRVLMRLLFRSF